MTPVIFFNLIVGIIGSFQVFTPAYIFFGTDGGPLNAGLFYMVHIYNNAFRFFKMGYATALSLVLFVFILLFTIILVRTSDRWVFYTGGGR
jgi:multiple sugar transport system permease protein